VPLLVESPDARDKSAAAVGEAACALGSGEAEDVSAGEVADSGGVAEAELSGADELSGVGNPGVSEGLLGGFP